MECRETQPHHEDSRRHRGQPGIGLAAVRTLIDEGVRVVGAARTITPELKDTGAYAVSADLGTADGVSALIDSALAELGGIDLLVNNVGGGDEATLGFLDADDAEWTRMFDINMLTGLRPSPTSGAGDWLM